METEVWAAQLLELDYKSSWYIELCASLALGPMCIGCSLSLQLSAWRGTVNDGFVLCPPFVLSWFLVQHKQAWNLFYSLQRNGGIQVRQPTIQLVGGGRVNLIFVLELCFRRFCLWWNEGTFISNWSELWDKWTVSLPFLALNYMTCHCVSLSVTWSGVGMKTLVSQKVHSKHFWAFPELK